MEDVPLFWTEEYARLHGGEHFLLPTQSGVVTLTRTGAEILKSPGRATFGGFWAVGCSNFQLSPNLIRELREYDSTFNELRISFPPSYFRPDVFESQVKFFDSNFSKKVVESNFHIVVNSRKAISKGNRKKQRQFAERGGEVGRLDSTRWRELYELLSANRLRRGVKLSMSWEVFERGLRDLPTKFVAWGATMQNQLVGGALTVEIDQNTLYVLFWGDSLLGRDISAVASVCESLVAHCISNDYHVLDLGISSVDGELDENLARFKTNLGAVSTTKPIFSLNIP
jgi:hypothetical protein